MAEVCEDSLRGAAISPVPESALADNGDDVVNGDDGDESQSQEAKVNGNVPPCDRVKRKAKRPSKFAPDLTRTKSETQILAAPLRPLKNSRKSRNGFGRGLPKKGGAGGKGTWGALGSELVAEDGVVEDARDPNYDDASGRGVRLQLIVDRERAAEEAGKKVSALVLEYFDHGDSDEVLVSLQELRLPDCARPVVVTAAVELALDHKPSHREMTSVLLADLYGIVLFEDDYAAAFDRLLTNLRELVLDTPDAETIVGNFVARSIADDCIPPRFLQRYKGKISCEHAVRAMARAEGLLSMRHGLVRLDNVWGVGGGTRPVKHLVKKMNLLLKEYVSAADVGEATRCLLDLEVPHFHHELVYEAVTMVLESLTEARTARLMCGLLTSLCAAVVLTPNHMKEGFLRIYDDLPQICLDVPAAYSILEKFVKMCHAAHILEEDVLKRLPSRGRKRFVSEGDGGRVKDHAYF